MPDGNAVSLAQVAGSTSDYSELKRTIKAAGLLERQSYYYAGKILLLLLLFSVSVAILVFVKSFYFQLFNVVFLAFVTTQIGLLGHDAGHRQIFRSTRNNDIVGVITANLFLGISHKWWMNRHNAHHSHPNQYDLDPDVSIPIIAFAPEDLNRKGSVVRFIMKYQAYFFFPVLTLALLDMQQNSWQYLFQQKMKDVTIEWSLLALHFVGYLGLLFYSLTFWQVVVFVFAHQIISGVYMGSIFAPNHKGMPVLDADCSLGFLERQVMTARNVYAHPVTDFWYGGLNYQIEHHLFPSMPRNRLREAQVLIKAFCQANAIPYYETNALQSYRETLEALHAVSAPLRVARQLS
jgi:fatty acid desaturase